MVRDFVKNSMIRRFFAVSILILSASFAQAQPFANATPGLRTLTLNEKVGKNQFIWLSEAPLENIKGTSEGVSGTVTFDPKDLSKMRGTISTQVCTMKTGNATRDKHLQSSEWLDGPRCALITFAIQSVDQVKTNGNAATGMATGNFTLHGITKKMTIPFKLTFVPESEKTRQRAEGDLVMIAAEFNISLKDFNVSGTNGTVGSKVGEAIKITAQLFGNAVVKTNS